MGPIILAKISAGFCASRFCSCVRARCDLCGRPRYVIVQLTDNIVWKRLTGRGQVPASVPFGMHAPRKLCSVAGPWPSGQSQRWKNEMKELTKWL